MTETRERDIIQAFLDLSNELVDSYDIVELLARLTMNCAQLLDIASSGLLLADRRGVLHLVAASSERTHDLEAFQLQRQEGPCLDCYHTGRPVTVPDLAEARKRWPHFAPAALGLGFASVHAVPMRLRDTVLGTLGLFGDRPGRLDAADLALAQALVHVASVAIVNEKSAGDTEVIDAQLQHALESRIVLEQAKGALAYVGKLDMDTAFTVLRRYARDHNEKLGDVTGRIVSRELRGERVMEHARSAGIVPPPRTEKDAT
ncbi:MAG TPA: GAF and ANTAR domain-containing protein [Lapillicoccus sp.]|nr:GAF and ANTAR domain-containing protein [Lapillicoccus sp.]